MKDILRVAGAYVGIIIGAGFASGQEIIQFFTSFGVWGIAGAIVTIFLFPLLGYQIIKLGEQLQVASHKGVVSHIAGRYLGPVLDIILTFFLFGVGVIMVAGSGSLFEQQFGVPPAVGYFLLIVLVILTTTLRTERITSVISYISPFMIALVLIIVGYSLLTSDMNFEELDNIAGDQLSAAPNWLLSALLYVSFNFSVGFAMMAVIGSTEKNKQAARQGAIVGGIVLGVMVLVLNLGIYANMDQLQGAEMPTLALATEISPLVGILMALALLGMIFNTATAMFYSFTARFVQPETPKFRGAVVIVGLIAFALGFVGFVDLVNTVYPMLGYVGFVLIGAVLVSLLRSRRESQ